MKNGKVHLYWGDGKGKTTAAMGLALRALGAGKRVTVVQFLKGTPSGEIPLLCRLGASVHRCHPGLKFVFQMTEEEKRDCLAEHTAMLRKALAEDADLLILDEACAACQLGMVEEAMLRRAVEDRPPQQEVVLTGRDPADWMRQDADYETEMCCRKHPYQSGLDAREGIEF